MIDDPFSDLLKTNKRKENTSKLNDDLAYEILSVVAGVVSHAENYGKFPCHRVVNHMGRLAPG